jgi:hypothetical protein
MNAVLSMAMRCARPQVKKEQVVLQRCNFYQGAVVPEARLSEAAIKAIMCSMSKASLRTR